MKTSENAEHSGTSNGEIFREAADDLWPMLAQHLPENHVYTLRSVCRLWNDRFTSPSVIGAVMSRKNRWWNGAPGGSKEREQVFKNHAIGRPVSHHTVELGQTSADDVDDPHNQGQIVLCGHEAAVLLGQQDLLIIDLPSQTVEIVDALGELDGFPLLSKEVVGLYRFKWGFDDKEGIIWHFRGESDVHKADVPEHITKPEIHGTTFVAMVFGCPFQHLIGVWLYDCKTGRTAFHEINEQLSEAPADHGVWPIVAYTFNAAPDFSFERPKGDFVLFSVHRPGPLLVRQYSALGVRQLAKEFDLKNTAEGASNQCRHPKLTRIGKNRYQMLLGEHEETWCIMSVVVDLDDERWNRWCCEHEDDRVTAWGDVVYFYSVDDLVSYSRGGPSDFTCGSTDRMTQAVAVNDAFLVGLFRKDRQYDVDVFGFAGTTLEYNNGYCDDCQSVVQQIGGSGKWQWKVDDPDAAQFCECMDEEVENSSESE